MKRFVWAALLLTAGAFTLSGAWAGPLPMAVLIGSAVLALLLVTLGSLRLPAPAVALAVVLGGLGAGYAFGVPAGAPPVTALRDGVARLLTEERPAPAVPELLLPGALLVLIVAAWVGLRTTAAGRPGTGLVAAPAGAIALYGTGALLSAGTADPHGIVAGAIVLVAAAGWFTVDTPRPPAIAPVTRLAPPAVLAAALSGIVAVAAGLVWAGTGFEPRHLVNPPEQRLTESSPLPRIAAWQQRGDQELLRATVDSDARLRLVVLTEYTGATWSATATYRRPGTAPQHPLPVAHQTNVSARVSIVGLDGPWLPTPGRAVSVSESNVDVEPDTGSLAVREGAASPGLNYSVQAVLDAPRTDEVAAAAVPTEGSMSRLVDLPRVPWALTDYARRATFGASSPFEQAVALEFAVREGRRSDAMAPVGSSYARLQTFLFRPYGSEPGAGAGTSEQFATAFAVLARAVGLPTRVVVGFGPGTPGPDGTRVLRGRDVQAWPEVYFAGLGWYGFDPSPSGATRTGTDEQLKLNVLDRMGEQVARATPVPVPSGSAAALPPGPSAAAPPSSLPGTGLAAGAATAVLLVLLTVLLGRSLRRARHRRAGERGAWAEVLDLLVLLGRPAPRWSPAPEVAASLSAFSPAVAGPAGIIATAADRAAFSPAVPGRGSQPPSSTMDGAEAWTALRQLRRSLRSVVPLRRRLLWPLDPRPLRRR